MNEMLKYLQYILGGIMIAYCGICFVAYAALTILKIITQQNYYGSFATAIFFVCAIIGVIFTMYQVHKLIKENE